MTYGYGEGVPPHRRQQHQDELNQSPGADASRDGRDWSQQYGSPQPPQYGGRPYAADNSARSHRPQPPGDFRTPDRGFSPPHHDVPRQRGHFPGGGYGVPTQYGGPGQQGAGPRREPPTYEADRYLPRARADQPRLSAPEPEPARRSRKLVIVAIIVVVLAVTGGGGWYFLHRQADGSGHGAGDVAAQKIADQKIDPIPLNDAEVFGPGLIPISAGGGSYKVVKTQAVNDCKTAVGGKITSALTAAGCTQVVRATLTSPDGAYVITAGIFNLADAAKARAAQAAIQTSLDAGTGRFGGMVAGGSTNVIELAAANAAWQVRGHYLAYCLVAKTDGSAIRAEDPRSHQIVGDVIEDYLSGTVIRKREAGSGPAAGGSATPSG